MYIYMYIYIYDLIFKEGSLYCNNFMQNYYDQTLTFNGSSFHHFVLEVNEIWDPTSLIIPLRRY